MTYYAKPNFIQYDKWFDTNIDPLDLNYYLDEKKFTNSVHENFYKLSTQNIIIGSSDNLFKSY